MKKISTLLMLFCAFVGTALAQVTELSQLSNDKIYAIKSGRCFLLYSEANADQLSTSTATAITDAERVEDAINNPNQQFKIQNNEGVYYLYSVGAKKYVTKNGSLSTAPVDALEIHDVRANFPNYPWKLCIGGSGVNTQVANQMATGVTVNSWTTADAGNTFQIVDIEEKPLFDALNELSTLVNNAKQELLNKHKVALQTTNASAPFYLSATQDADGNTLSNALDNNPSTFYGSSWGASVGHLHYWQVDLADAANLEEFTFSYVTRANGNDTPTQINVQGSTDGTTFTDIVVLTDGLPTTGGATYKSTKIDNDGYRYLRFEVPSTTTNFHAGGNEDEVTIAIAEFSMIDTNLNNYSVSDKNKANAISAAEEVLNADNNTLKTVQDAIDAFNAALVSGQCTVSYSFVYKGVEKLTQTVTTFVGEDYPEITVALPYGISAVKPAGVIEEGDVVEGAVTKTIELTDNLPFVAAADYASIKNWYYIQMHSSGGSYSRYIQAMDSYIEWLDVDMNASDVDSYTWGFIGNPFDGFKLVNYANGNTKGVNANASADPVINPAMGDIATATAWTIKPSRTNPTAQYFCFQYPGSNQYMNAQSGKVAFWGDNDQGSTLWVTERDLSGATELQAVIDQVEAFVAAGVANGTTVGYLTSESVANVATALAAAENAVETKTGCIEAQAALQAAVAAVETIQPEEGKFYVIASAVPESDGRSGQKMYVNNEGGMQFNNGNAIANVFQFVSDGDGKFFLKSVDRGTYMNSAKSHNGGQETAVAAETENAKAIAIANMGRANVVSLIPNGGAMMHAQASGSSVVAWNNTDNAGASAWVISEVNIEDFAHTVAVTEAGWATLYLGYNATIPTGVKAYAVAEVADYATLAEVTGVLPANQAVLLEAAQGEYDFDYATEAPASIETNLLKGTVFNTNFAEEAYVLGYVGEEGNKEVGFYTAALNVSTDKTNDGTEEAPAVTYEAWLNNAFKAYLPKTVQANALRFNFGGNTTAIESVLNNGVDANAPIYDLSGRRVNNAVKGGIYIKNGKKFIVK